MPMTPISVRASFTSSSLNGLMIASTCFISYLLQDGEDQRGHVRADALEIREHVEMDLRRFERPREAQAKPAQMRLAQLALALPQDRTLVQHLLGQRAIVGGERRDGALQVLRHHAVELEDLGPAGVGEPERAIELLSRELHQVLVDDVADVLEIADHGDERDLLLREIGPHRGAVEARQEELDLALEEVHLI